MTGMARTFSLCRTQQVARRRLTFSLAQQPGSGIPPCRVERPLDQWWMAAALFIQAMLAPADHHGQGSMGR